MSVLFPDLFTFSSERIKHRADGLFTCLVGGRFGLMESVVVDEEEKNKADVTYNEEQAVTSSCFLLRSSAV